MQEQPTPGDSPTGGEIQSDDPRDAPWPEDEDDDDADQPQVNPEPQAPAPGEKQTEAVPDSLRGALPDSLARPAVNPSAARADSQAIFRGLATKAKPLNAPPAERKPPFGLHPALLFLGLLVGHVFVVRAVTN